MLLRDRIIDFVEGAKPSQVKSVTDTSCSDTFEIDYAFTHDRYFFDHEFDMYRKHMDTWPDEYADDYIKFFRSSGVGRGRFIEEEAIGDYKV